MVERVYLSEGRRNAREEKIKKERNPGPYVIESAHVLLDDSLGYKW